MKTTTLALALSLALSPVLSSAALLAADAAAPAWPAAAGWRSETIPFPLEFAPQIARKGVEEIRFAPGFGKPAEPNYFSYAFLWVLTSREELDAESLRKELKLYFDGLVRAVAKEAKLDLPVDTRVVLQAMSETAAFPGTPTFRAAITTVDPFYTKKTLNLRMHIYTDACPNAAGRTVYFEASPRLTEEQVGKTLEQVRTALVCR